MFILLIFKTGNLIITGTETFSKWEMQCNLAFPFNIALLFVMLETFASKSYVACYRGNTSRICSQTLSSVPALDPSCAKRSYIWDFRKNLKDLIEMLLRTWIWSCNAGGHSFCFCVFIFFCHVLKGEIFVLLFVLHCSCIFHWIFFYSDIKVTKKFRFFFTFKILLSFPRLYNQELHLVITFE